MAEDMRAAKAEEEELRALVQAAAGTPGARARRPLVALAVAGLAIFAVAATASGRLIKMRTLASGDLNEGAAANSESGAVGSRGESAAPAWIAARMAATSLMSAVPDLAALPRHRALQVLCLAWVFLTAAQSAFLIPDAHGVMVAEYSLVSSSWFTFICLILSAFTALGARRLMKPWNQRWNCTLVLVIAALQPGLAMVYLLLLDQASPMRLGLSNQLRTMMFIRLAVSTCMGFNSLLVFMAQRVMPADELVKFGMQRACATILGTGSGIFMAAYGPAMAISAGAEAATSSSSTRTTLLLFSTLWVALVSALAVLRSRDAGPMFSNKAVAEANSIVSDANEALMTFMKANGKETQQVVAQRKLWLSSCVVACQRGLLTSGLEVLMASVWTARFVFEPADVGLGLGACFLLGAFLAPLAIALAHRGGSAAEVEVLGILAGLCVCASLLLFGAPGAALGGGDTGVWLTFLAGTLVLPSSFLLAGTMEGLAMRHATADSAYNQENLLTFSAIFQDLSVRLFGPSMMHGLFAVGGQIVSASANLGVALLLPAIAYNSRSMLHAIPGTGAVREGSNITGGGAAAAAASPAEGAAATVYIRSASDSPI
mmetsp:Transcript_145136/g.253275  ORF Transcript_145136/g.253275 Transcript_145136/m.253275 type:complete len:602 (-) Transcript_145136:9-1814(-)